MGSVTSDAAYLNGVSSIFAGRLNCVTSKGWWEASSEKFYHPLTDMHNAQFVCRNWVKAHTHIILQ